MAFQQFAHFRDEKHCENKGEITSSAILNARYLNQLKCKYSPHLNYSFIEQETQSSGINEESRYYEEIIFQDKTIPTRSDSWHDYFNGLIWLTFPQSKAYLNRLHWQDIAQFGHKQRSSTRDRITHFDECGMILVTDLPEVEDLLKAHNWEALFIDNKQRWFEPSNGIMPVHFGHANLEMLRKPFIGLTAKTIVIQNKALLKAAHLSCFAERWDSSVVEAQQALDSAVLHAVQQDSIFAEKRRLMPMPILGIPNWHNETQDKAFYQNKAYFMPKRQ